MVLSVKVLHCLLRLRKVESCYLLGFIRVPMQVLHIQTLGKEELCSINGF